MHFAHIGVILDKNPCIAIQPPSKAIMMPNRLEPELDIYQYPEHLRASHFDSDGYKILCKPLMGGDYRIIELSS